MQSKLPSLSVLHQNSYVTFWRQDQVNFGYIAVIADVKMWRNIIVVFNTILKAYSSAKTRKWRQGNE